MRQRRRIVVNVQDLHSHRHARDLRGVICGETESDQKLWDAPMHEEQWPEDLTNGHVHRWTPGGRWSTSHFTVQLEKRPFCRTTVETLMLPSELFCESFHFTTVLVIFFFFFFTKKVQSYLFIFLFIQQKLGIFGPKVAIYDTNLWFDVKKLWFCKIWEFVIFSLITKKKKWRFSEFTFFFFSTIQTFPR